jgi:uncharacterized protein YbjT (DUF2867 family)
MKILLTGATGYIGKRLLPVLIEQGHEVVCCVRDKKRFPTDGIYKHPNVSVFEVDFLKDISLSDSTALSFPRKPALSADRRESNNFTSSVASSSLQEIDAAYYLIHSMSSNVKDFGSLEETSANNFIKLVKQTSVKQIIYLGGITNEEKLSKHLASRKRVEEILAASGIPLTSIKAGITVGSGSASFEIIRDLVEKLPVMIEPKWLNTKHQPIAIRNILEYLTGVLLKSETFNKSYDVGGPDILSYKEMLLQLAEVRGLKRFIYTVPIMTPRLSSYWLYFVTSTSYMLAINLVNSMKIEVVAKDNELEKMLGIKPISYKEAVQLAFQKIEQNNVVSSWKDSLISSYVDNSLLEHINVPTNGCFVDKREKEITTSVEQILENIWSIGGERGWYYGDWLWHLRGFLDKLAGGVGLRRGRTNKTEIHTGDTLDFWRRLRLIKKTKDYCFMQK